MNWSLFFAFAVPIAFTFYLTRQISQREIKDWQVYACLSFVVGFVSFLFLAGSGWLESVSVGPAKVDLVTKKVEEAKAILAKIKQVALATADAAILAKKPLRASSMDTAAEYESFRTNIVQLLDVADATADQKATRLRPIESYLEQLRKEEADPNHPLRRP